MSNLAPNVALAMQATGDPQFVARRKQLENALSCIDEISIDQSKAVLRLLVTEDATFTAAQFDVMSSVLMHTTGATTSAPGNAFNASLRFYDNTHVLEQWRVKWCKNWINGGDRAKVEVVEAKRRPSDDVWARIQKEMANKPIVRDAAALSPQHEQDIAAQIIAPQREHLQQASNDIVPLQGTKNNQTGHTMDQLRSMTLAEVEPSRLHHEDGRLFDFQDISALASKTSSHVTNNFIFYNEVNSSAEVMAATEPQPKKEDVSAFPSPLRESIRQEPHVSATEAQALWPVKSFYSHSAAVPSASLTAYIPKDPVIKSKKSKSKKVRCLVCGVKYKEECNVQDEHGRLPCRYHTGKVINYTTSNIPIWNCCGADSDDANGCFSDYHEPA